MPEVRYKHLCGPGGGEIVEGARPAPRGVLHVLAHEGGDGGCLGHLAAAGQQLGQALQCLVHLVLHRGGEGRRRGAMWVGAMGAPREGGWWCIWVGAGLGAHMVP